MSEAFTRPFTKAEMEAIRRAARDEHRVLRDVWAKVKRLGRSVPFAEDLLAAYFCVRDPATPRRVRLILLGALAYFALPADAVADFLPLLGFTDDAAVLAAAITSVAAAIKDVHRVKAKEALRDAA